MIIDKGSVGNACQQRVPDLSAERSIDAQHVICPPQTSEVGEKQAQLVCIEVAYRYIEHLCVLHMGSSKPPTQGTNMDLT